MTCWSPIGKRDGNHSHALIILFRPLLFASIEPEVAEARGRSGSAPSDLFPNSACAECDIDGESGWRIIGLCTFGGASRRGGAFNSSSLACNYPIHIDQFDRPRSEG